MSRLRLKLSFSYIVVLIARARDRLGGDIAASTRPVLDDEWLAKEPARTRRVRRDLPAHTGTGKYLGNKVYAELSKELGRPPRIRGSSAAPETADQGRRAVRAFPH